MALKTSVHQHSRIMQPPICTRAMLLLQKASGKDIIEYGPIAKALCTLDESTEMRLMKN